jgi:hypothetical protein
MGLIPGATYKLCKVEVGGFATNIYLEEYPGKVFNSVCFEEMNGDPETDYDVFYSTHKE